MGFVFWNGIFSPEKDVKVPLSDRGFLFGDGVFTTVKVIQGKAEALDRHLKHLRRDCEQIGISPPSIEYNSVEQLIAKNHATQGLWRLKIIVTGGEEEGLNLPLGRKGQCIMTLKPYEGISYSPVFLGIYPYPVQSLLSKVKSLAYIERLWIKDYATQRQLMDCIVKDAEGHILETAFANIFWTREDQLYIPDTSLSYYVGTFMERVIDTAKQYKQSIHFIKAKEIPCTAQVYLCNSMIGICPVLKIEQTEFSRNFSFEKFLQQRIDDREINYVHH